MFQGGLEMNRPQFLAELNQYLTFFTPEVRTAIMASYTQRFDDAGEEGEGGLIVELGTPMRVAIGLKRRQEAGDDFSELFDAAGEAPDYRVETETPESLAQEQPDETGCEPGGADELSDDLAADDAPADDAAPETDTQAAPAAVQPAPRKLSGGRIVGGVLGSIVVVAFALCIAAAGALCLTAAGCFIMAGLKTLLTLTDALYLFAGGLVLGGVGLLAVWFAIWAAVSLVTKLFRPASADGQGV